MAIIAAAIPALRPLWAKRANQIQASSGQVRRPNNKRPQSSTYVMMDPLMEADTPPSRIETRITAQGGKNQGHVGGEATSLSDCDKIMKTSYISTENFRRYEGGQWIPEHSSSSNGERRVGDIV